MLDNGTMVKKMDTENKHGQMVLNTKENGVREKHTGKELSFIQMEMFTMVLG